MALCVTFVSSTVLGAAVQTPIGRLPLYFEQTPEGFATRGSGFQLKLDRDGAAFELGSGSAQRSVRLRVSGARTASSPEPEEAAELRTSYFIGNDPALWSKGRANYLRVRYASIRPGVDLLYYGTRQKLEYDFIVQPGANPGAIAWEVCGADSLTLNETGDVVMHTTAGDLLEHRPVAYQMVRGKKVLRRAEYRLQGGGVGFRVGSYDHSLPLVIDPVLTFSSFLGGAGNDQITAIAVDAFGNTFLAGNTTSVDFPTTPGAYKQSVTSGTYLFVSKVNAAAPRCFTRHSSVR